MKNKKKITRKIALELLEKEFGDADGDADHVRFLCAWLPEKLKSDFWGYWEKINTEKHNSLGMYFGCSFEFEDEELSILRLLTAFFFIEDTYK